MKIHIKGQIRGGKNNMGITRTGRHYPKPEFVKWREEAMRQVYSTADTSHINNDSMLWYIDYTPSDKRRRDVPAILDSIFHVLEKCKIVTDDSIIKNVNFKTYPVDKERAGIFISAVRPDSQSGGGGRYIVPPDSFIKELEKWKKDIIFHKDVDCALSQIKAYLTTK